MTTRWIQTFTNKKLDLDNPKPEQVDIIDIAIGLSRAPRFNGQSLFFYSVAQHSWLMSKLTDDSAINLYALLHDAHEAYIGDISAPVKLFCAEIPEMERRIQSAIYKKYDIPPPDEYNASNVKFLDMAMLKKEKDTLFNPPLWDVPYPSAAVSIERWSINYAFTMFLERFHELL